MELREKSWIKHYLHFRNQYALQKEFEQVAARMDTPYNREEFLYQLLQPTGMLYGHPAQLPIHNKSLLRALKVDSLKTSDKIKIILLESFLHSALTSPRYQEIENTLDMADAILDAALLIGKFYKKVYEGLETRTRHWFFYQEKKGLELTEFILENKVNPPFRREAFWSDFFDKSLVFLDIFYFSKWIAAEKSGMEPDRVVQAHEAMRLLIMQVFVTAALANRIIEPEEKKLFDYYIEAAKFSAQSRQLCQQFLENPTPLEALDLQQIDSQVLKKYIFELALLIIYADKLLTKEEKKYMELLRSKLDLEKKEVESSQMAVESFMVSHWQQMEFLQNPSRLTVMQEQVMNKLSRTLSRNRHAFMHQVKNKPELNKLINKASKEKLTKEEKNKLRQELIEAIGSLPSTMLQTIPKTFFTYPVLMQIIPDNIMQPKKGDIFTNP